MDYYSLLGSKLFDLYEQMDAPYYIGPSQIHGDGVHAKSRLNKGSIIGKVTDVAKKDEPMKTTTMGKMINHSWKPNCELKRTGSHEGGGYHYYTMHTLQDIEPNEELTLNYDKYDDFADADPNWK